MDSLPEDEQGPFIKNNFHLPQRLQSQTDLCSDWATEEDDQLKEAFSNSIKISQLAKDHQRTTGTIRPRFKKLGLIADNKIA